MKNAQSIHLQKLTIQKFDSKVLSNEFKITDSETANRIARRFWDDSIEIFESFNVICLNNANCPIAWVQLSQGGIDGTVADIRLIFSHALLCNAVGIIIFHNHPSGNLKPSQADISLTEKIKKAGEIMSIPLLDHLIITENGFYSFADQGVAI